MSEKRVPEVSWSTDLSPTTIFTVAASTLSTLTCQYGGGGVYPGWVAGWVPGRAIPGTTHPALQDPDLVIF